MRETIIGIHYQKGGGPPEYAFPLTFDLVRTGEQWTGTCLELGTSTFGDTFDEVKTELQESVTLQLNEVERLGFIADYLEENHVNLIRFPDPNSSFESAFTLVSA